MPRTITLVYDLSRRRLVWVGEHRDTATMTAFFHWLGPRRARSIQVVCCDMWAIYLEAVQQHLPHAQVVFDRFHVVQHLHRAVDQVRRDTWRTLSGLAKVAFKRTRWLWLKNPCLCHRDTRLAALRRPWDLAGFAGSVGTGDADCSRTDRPPPPKVLKH